MKWEVKRIGDFCETGSGGTPSRSQATRYFDGKIPWVKSGELKEDVIFDTEEHINDLAIQESAAKIVPAGALLVALYGATVGRIATLGVNAATNQAVCYIVPHEEVDRRFLFYALRTCVPQWLAQRVGGAQPNISQQIIKDTEIRLPPFSEQKRIAGILDQADRLRRKCEQTLDLGDDLLRSTFLDLFGDPVTNPQNWPVVSLGDALTGMQYGTSTKCSAVREPDALPVLRIPNISGGALNRGDMKFAVLPPAERASLMLRNGDILFVRTNGNPEYIGRCAVYEDGEPTLFASYLIRATLRTEAMCRIRFLKDVLSFPSYRTNLVRVAQTTAGNYNVSIQGLNQLRIALPPIDLQDKYLKLVAGMANCSIKTRKQASTAVTLFESLVQRAFNGEL